jgi:outer membrane receptor protein involved in Fe transport
VIRKRPGYALYNFNAGATHGDWDVSVWVQNLNNKRAEVSGQGSSTDIMGPRVIYATPRTIGTNISYSFK